mgnify:FL=1
MEITREQILNDFFEFNLSYTSYEPMCNYPENTFELKLKFNEIKREMAENPYSDYHRVFSGMGFESFKKLIDSEYSEWLVA